MRSCANSPQVMQTHYAWRARASAALQAPPSHQARIRFRHMRNPDIVTPDERERAQLGKRRPCVGAMQAQELKRALHGRTDSCYARQAVGRFPALPVAQRGM